jgi:phosphate-selective porin
MGIYGAFFPSGNSRLTYEIYGVNGLHDGIVEGSDEGTRIASGRHNIEDNNNSPAFTGRIAYSPLPSAEVGVSWHVGQYNKSRLEDLDVDESRSAKIYALDWEGTQGRFHLVGEYARATVDLPSSLAGSIYADSQDGLYVQASAGFGSGWLTHLPESSFEGVVRYDRVDFDRSIEGDQVRQWGIGLNFKPVSDAAFKLNYFKKWARDRNNVLGRGAGVLFSLATYF